MNLLKPRIPKGFRLKAQGCRVLASPARTEPTLGWRHRRSTTLKGLRQMYATGSTVHAEPRFASHRHWDHEPRFPRTAAVSDCPVRVAPSRSIARTATVHGNGEK